MSAYPQIRIAGLLLLVVTLFSIIFVVKKSKNPNQTWIACALDVFCIIPMLLRFGPWGKLNDINIALQDAILETGLDSIGGNDQTSFLKRYEATRKLGMERSKLKYSPFGYFQSYYILKNWMINRLKFFNYLKHLNRQESLNAQRSSKCVSTGSSPT
jgi:hypothetical protein